MLQFTSLLCRFHFCLVRFMFFTTYAVIIHSLGAKMSGKKCRWSTLNLNTAVQATSVTGFTSKKS